MTPFETAVARLHWLEKMPLEEATEILRPYEHHIKTEEES